MVTRLPRANPCRQERRPTTSTPILTASHMPTVRARCRNSQDWLGGSYSVEFTEDVVGLGGYGRTLTILAARSAVDVDEVQENEELVESWRPRGIVRLIRLDPKNLQSRTIRLPVDASRPGRRLGLV